MNTMAMIVTGPRCVLPAEATRRSLMRTLPPCAVSMKVSRSWMMACGSGVSLRVVTPVDFLHRRADDHELDEAAAQIIDTRLDADHLVGAALLGVDLDALQGFFAGFVEQIGQALSTSPPDKALQRRR